jgi:hypothetical protein
MILYGLVPTSSIAATHAFGTGVIGIATNKYAYPLVGHVNFDAGQTVIDQRKATGLPYRRTGAGYEYQQGVKSPTTTWEFDANAYNLALPLWLLFQKGTTEASAGASSVKTYESYTCTTGVEMETFAALLKRMECGTVGSSQRILGAIVRSITFTAESNNPLKASVEFVGADISVTYSAENAVFTFDTNDPLIWGSSDANVYVSPAGNSPGTAINVDTWSVTISNNSVAKQYEKDTVQKFIMQDFSVEGTIKIPWGAAAGGGGTLVDDLITGDDMYIAIYWGSKTGASSGDFALMLNARITAVEMSYDDEVAQDITFSGAYDGTNPPAQIVLHDGAVDRSIP